MGVARQLEVERVSQRVEGRRSLVEQLQQSVVQLDEVYSVADDICQSRELIGSLEERRKSARNYSEDLLEDMLALDKLSGLASSDRSLRKVTIAKIEAMLDVLDEVKTKISSLHKQAEKHVAEKIEEHEATAYKSEVKRFEQPQSAATSQPGMGTSSDRFRKQVPLRLEFQVHEEVDRYVVVAPVKNLNMDDLQLKLARDARTLLIKGSCPPVRPCARQPMCTSPHACDDERDLAGCSNAEVGAFSERLQIPDDVETRGIKATYQGDLFRILLPKLQPQTRRQVIGGRPRMPFSA